MNGFCACGCGRKTRRAPYTDRAKGWVRGMPLKYLRGHNVGAAHPQWSGGRTVHANGYVSVHAPDHPNAHNGRVLEHVLVAEEATGLALPKKAQVHHVDGNPSNNSPGNLVVCEDQEYHLLLHRRMRARGACGHPGWLRCRYCKEYDTPANLSISGQHAYHKACAAEYQRRRKAP